MKRKRHSLLAISVLAATLSLFPGIALCQSVPGSHTAWMSNGNETFNLFPGARSGFYDANGLWLTGDFNGDGRADAVHAVQNTNYVHTWMSNGNGTFTVGTFSPWQGYAIPNGLWLVGDINGDGKADIVHAVQGTDYVHPWISRGDGTFTVGTFRPWQGYGIPNGEWFTGDFNGDGKIDLFHAVRNTDYVHVWTSRGDSTFNVGTFRPSQGYAISNGIWLTGDFNKDARTDLLHLHLGSPPPRPCHVHGRITTGSGPLYRMVVLGDSVMWGQGLREEGIGLAKRGAR